MAVVHYDPAIDSFSNRLGGFVYYTSRSTRCVRRYVVPRNPRTEKQQAGRICFAAAVRRWQELALYKRLQWNARARLRGISGYSLFISEHLVVSRGGAASGMPSAFRVCPAEPLRLRSVPVMPEPGRIPDALPSGRMLWKAPS